MFNGLCNCFIDCERGFNRKLIIFYPDFSYMGQIFGKSFVLGNINVNVKTMCEMGVFVNIRDIKVLPISFCIIFTLFTLFQKLMKNQYFDHFS